MLGQRARDPQREPGVLVRAVGVAQVLMLTRCSRARSAPASSANAWSSASCARRGELVERRRARPSSATSITPWSPCTDAERLAARQRAPELVQRQAEPGALGRPAAPRPASPPRAHREHGDARAGDQQLAAPRARARRPRARRRRRRAAPPSSRSSCSRCGLLELVAAVHRGADLRRRALRRVAVGVGQRLVGVDQPQVAEQRALAADRHAHARLQPDVRPRRGADGLGGVRDALREVQVADHARRLARQDRGAADLVLDSQRRAVREQAKAGVIDEHRAVEFRAQLLDEGLDLVIARGHTWRVQPTTRSPPGTDPRRRAGTGPCR